LKRPSQQGKSHRLAQASEHVFNRLLGFYDRTLLIVLKHRGATIAFAAGVLAVTGVLFVGVPKGFIPDQDTDQISVTTEAAQGTSYDKLVDYQERIAEIVKTDPNVEG